MYRAWKIEGVALERTTAAVAELCASALFEQLGAGSRHGLDGDALNQLAVMVSANQFALNTLSLTDREFIAEVQHMLSLAHAVREANKPTLGNQVCGETSPSVH